MFYQNFEPTTVVNMDCCADFYDIYHTFEHEETTTYEEVMMNRNVPEQCCLWKDEVHENQQTFFRMHYVVRKCGKNHSKILQKVTICQPDIYQCTGQLISTLTSLLSNDIEPRYYHMKNDLVTERVIYLRQVCVYRDFLWNTENRLSFMAKEHYHLVDRKVRKSYSGPNTLRHELMAIMSDKHEGRIAPRVHERPSGPRIEGWPVQFREGGCKPFWPSLKDDIIDNLKDNGYLKCYPTLHSKIQQFRENTRVRREDKDELYRLTCEAKENCDHCEQDYCVWSMNHKMITDNIILTKGGIWKDMYSNTERVEIGCKMAIFITNNGNGRRYDRRGMPKCVEEALEEIWPVNELTAMPVMPPSRYELQERESRKRKW